MKYLILLFSIFSLVAQAQEDLDLAKAIAMALENNYNIKISDTVIQISENSATWGRAGKYPTIELNSTFGANVINDNNPASFLNGTFVTGGLGVSADVRWQVYNGGRVKINKAILDKAVTVSQQSKKSIVQDVVLGVTNAYKNILLQQERYELLRESLGLSHRRLAYEETKREFGSSNSFNIVQFEDAVMADSIALRSQDNIVDIAKRNLYDLLTISTEQAYTFGATLSVVPEDIDMSVLKDELTESNLTLRSLKINEELQALNMQLAEAARKPVISVGATGGAQENYFKFFEDNPQTGEPFAGTFASRFNFGLNANLTWNLYDGGVRKADIQNAKLEQEIAKMDILSATMSIYNQLEILEANYKQQIEQLTLVDSRLEIVNRNLEMAAERLKLGRITSIDYRSIQNQYLSTAFTKVSAIYDLLSTKTQIDYLVGRYAG